MNHYWRRVGHRTLISREGRRYHKCVCALLAAAGVRTLHGRLEVTVWVFPPDHRRRDLDNIQKALLDALEHGGAYDDDSQIDALVIKRGKVVPGGRTVVEITEIGTDGTAPVPT